MNTPFEYRYIIPAAIATQKTAKKINTPILGFLTLLLLITLSI